MKVLVTGGAGFLGRGILRRAEELNWQVTVFSRDETKQFDAQTQYPKTQFVLGDVRDTDRLATAAAGHDMIIHAAAMKYIPEAELNAQECVAVNVGGAESVIKAAKQAGVERVVGISTDKAVQPVNIYGCTKMAMERMFAEASTQKTKFTTVRYGNVIGSTGSVIPLFRRQAAESVDGKVKLTNPHMTRFWMGIDEAIDLIVKASLLTPGAVFIPYVRSMKMADVVIAAVGEVEVEIIGKRPGEKEHEFLLHHEESVRVQQYDSHFELLPPGHSAGTEPFTLCSRTPHNWMEPEEMRALIRDAQEV